MGLQHHQCHGVLLGSKVGELLSNNPEFQKELDTISSLLMESRFSNGLNFEKLSTGKTPRPLYSLRLNQKGRLLVTKAVIDGVVYWVVLEALLEHEYESSSLLKKGGLRDYLQKESAGLAMQAARIRATQAVPVSPVELSLSDELSPITELNFYNQLIVLNSSQERASASSLPMVVTGMPGSGKSCVALSVLMQCIDQSLAYGNTLPILYVTSSKFLAQSMQSIYESSPSRAKELNIPILFKSYRELMLELRPELSHLSPVSNTTFQEWLHEYLKKQGQELSKHLKKYSRDELANKIYQEFRIISGYDLKSYLKLGKRESLFESNESDLIKPAAAAAASPQKDQSQSIRRALFDAFDRYCRHLEANKQIDWAFQSLPKRQGRYFAVLTDEAQDFSLRDLDNLISLATERRTACFLDTNQSLNDELSKIQFIKQKIHLHDNSHIRLSESIRCARKIVDLANSVLGMKLHVTGGLVEKGGDSQVVCVKDSIEGELVWPESSDETLTFLKKETDTLNCAVVTLPSLVDEARKHFPGAVIMTVEQAKGLEYDTVIAYKLLEHPEFQELDYLLTDYNPKAGHAAARPKHGEDHHEYGPVFNNLFTAITRAKNKFIIYDQKNCRARRNLLRNLSAEFTSSMLSVKAVETSTPEAWLEEAKKHLRREAVSVAQEICFTRLQYTKERFEQLCQTVRTEHLKPPVDDVEAKSADKPQNDAVKSQKALKPTPTAFKPPKKKEEHAAHATGGKKNSDVVHCHQLSSLSVAGVKKLLSDLLKKPNAMELLIDEEYLDEKNTNGKCLLELLLERGHDQVICDLLIKSGAPYKHKFTARELFRARKNQKDKYHENDSALGVIVRVQPSLLSSLFASSNYLANSSNEELAEGLYRIRTDKSGPCENSSPFLFLCHTSTGLALLWNLFDANPKLMALLPKDTLYGLMTAQAGSLENVSAFSSLCSSAARSPLFSKLLESVPQLFNDIPSGVLCSSFDNKSFSLLHYLLSNEGIALFIRLLKAFPTLATKITPEILCDDTFDNDSILVILIRGKRARIVFDYLLTVRPSLADMITSAALCGKGKKAGTSPLWTLCSTSNEPQLFEKLLTLAPQLAERITSIGLCLPQVYEPGHSSSPLFELCRRKEGIILLNQLLYLSPALAKKITLNALRLKFIQFENKSAYDELMLTEEGKALYLRLVCLNPELEDRGQHKKENRSPEENSSTKLDVRVSKLGHFAFPPRVQPITKVTHEPCASAPAA